MNRLSIKGKVTLWYVIFMLILVGLVFTLVLSVSDSLIRQTSQNRLISIVEDSFEEIEYDDGNLEIDDDLDFFQQGVYLSVYDKSEQLVYGRTPTGFDDNTAISWEVQKISSGTSRWYVYDLSAEISDYGEVRVRGVTALSDAESPIQTMILILVIALPFLVLVAAAGGYYITKKAFLPVVKMANAAQEITSGEDLSRRIQLEDGNDEIFTLAKIFDNMLDRLQHSFEKEKQFTSDASHELRTPIAVILSQTEYALDNAKTLDEAKESLDIVVKQAKKMSAMVAQLLTLTRIDKKKQQLDLEMINLSEITEMVVEEQQIISNHKNINIRTDLEPDIILFADQTMMMRVLINLISNAINYGRDGGNVRVSLKKDGGAVMCTVKDDGIGIAKEHLDKIWDRFYQVNPARTAKKESGSGLGLAMVRWIINAHGGQITAKSTPGKGSLFSFSIPLREDESKQ